MQGVFINGSRPKTKKALREQVEKINEELVRPTSAMQTHALGFSVVIEATSFQGNEFDGSLALLLRYLNDPSKNPNPASSPIRLPIYLVGPDPRTKRNWYASLDWDRNKERWVVK